MVPGLCSRIWPGLQHDSLEHGLLAYLASGDPRPGPGRDISDQQLPRLWELKNCDNKEVSVMFDRLKMVGKIVIPMFLAGVMIRLLRDGCGCGLEVG